MPGDLPTHLIPPAPGVAFSGTSGSTRLVRFSSSATLADVQSFYSSVLGAPDAAPGDGSPIWFTDGPKGIITVDLTGTDNNVRVDIVIYDAGSH